MRLAGIKTNSLAMRIASGYAVVIAALIAVVSFSLARSIDVKERSEDIARYTVPAVTASLRLQTGVNESLSALNAWVNLGGGHFIHARNEAWGRIDESLNRLRAIARAQDDVFMEKDLDVLFEDLEQLRHYQYQVESIAQTLDNFPGLKLLETQAAPLMETILQSIAELIHIESNKQEIHTENRKLLVTLANLRHSTVRSLMAMRTYLTSNDNRDYEAFNQAWKRTEELFAQVQQSDRLNEQQGKIIGDISSNIDRFIVLPDQIFDYRQGPEWDVAKLRIEKWMGPLKQKIEANIQAMTTAQKERLTYEFAAMNRKFERLITLGAWMLLGAVVMCSIIGFFITRMIVRPFGQVIAAAGRITEGDFDVSVNIHGTCEAESLRQALNAMTAFLRRIAMHASEIAQGNFEQDFDPRSDKDMLGKALRQMTIDLRAARDLHAREAWLRTGQAGLADALRGLVDVQQIADAGSDYIATYTEAQVAAVYLSDEQMVFRLASQYAFKPQDHEREYKLGEGLIGQAAKDGRIHYLSSVPADHYSLAVESGLGQSQARCIAVVPLVSKQDLGSNCGGVVALAYDHELETTERELLEKAGEYLCISLTSAKSRARLQTLLEESQQQAEELESQKDELRATNEELEAQAQALQQSKEALRIRSDDLRGNNLLLEQQKRAVEQKNKEVEEARAELERKACELAQASKYKSEFLANMSHELRSPLNSLLILAESLAKNRHNNLTEDQVEDARVIHDAGETLLLLINDILDLSKVEAGKLVVNIEPFSLAPMIDSIVSQFRPVAEKTGLHFDTECIGHCPPLLQSDEQRLKQILRNLLSNAFKFTHDGTVKLEYGQSPDDDQKLYFRVVDTGIGIPKAMQQFIFEAFQQGDGAINRMYNGSGLGLAISRELAALIGGDLQLQSEEGQGSRFTLTLPLRFSLDDLPQQAEPAVLAAAEAQISAIVADPADDSSAALLPLHKSVLIAEDDLPFAKKLIEIAEQHGFHCVHAKDGRQALDLLAKQRPSAVILDIGLPKISGLEVLDVLKSAPETRRVPVHLISAQDGDHELIRKGAVGFLPKPASLNDLDQVFSRFTTLLRQEIGQVLLFGGSEQDYLDITDLLQERRVVVQHLTDSTRFSNTLREHQYDCCIVDMDAQDILSSDWLAEIQADGGRGLPPLIVYTSTAMTDTQYECLSRYIDAIVMKGECSPERLKDEVECFLHSVNAALPEDFDAAEIGTTSSLSGRRVLLVDDDLRNAYALSKSLKEHGMEIFLADNGALALQKMEEEGPFDLVLMDIMMPVMDGYTAMHHIREHHSTTLPIIALTAKAMDDDKAKCLEAGASDYLAKPLATDQLLAMIKIWLLS